LCLGNNADIIHCIVYTNIQFHFNLRPNDIVASCNIWRPSGRSYKTTNIIIVQAKFVSCVYTIIIVMIYLLTTVGLTPGGSSTVHIYIKTPGGSSTVHIYIQTVHRTTQLTTLIGSLSGIRTQIGQTTWEACGSWPVFVSYTLAFALQPRKKHG
jgi:hypothetical protein